MRKKSLSVLYSRGDKRNFLVVVHKRACFLNVLAVTSNSMTALISPFVVSALMRHKKKSQKRKKKKQKSWCVWFVTRCQRTASWGWRISEFCIFRTTCWATFPRSFSPLYPTSGHWIWRTTTSNLSKSVHKITSGWRRLLFLLLCPPLGIVTIIMNSVCFYASGR